MPLTWPCAEFDPAIHLLASAGCRENGDMDWSRVGISLDLLREKRSSAHSVSRPLTPDVLPEGTLLTNCRSTTLNQYLPKRLRSLFTKRWWHCPKRVPLPQGHSSLFARRFL